MKEKARDDDDDDGEGEKGCEMEKQGFEISTEM